MCRFAILRAMNINVPLNIQDYSESASSILNVLRYYERVAAFKGLSTDFIS